MPSSIRSPPTLTKSWPADTARTGAGGIICWCCTRGAGRELWRVRVDLFIPARGTPQDRALQAMRSLLAGEPARFDLSCDAGGGSEMRPQPRSKPRSGRWKPAVGKPWSCTT
jgi:hypothetical protein